MSGSWSSSKEERYRSMILLSVIFELDICWIREVNSLTSCSISAYCGWTRKLCRVPDCWRISESSRVRSASRLPRLPIRPCSNPSRAARRSPLRVFSLSLSSWSSLACCHARSRRKALLTCLSHSLWRL